MASLKKPKILALTGGIGAGKSTAASYFADLGAKVLSADSLAREAVEPSSPASQEIRVEFGDAFFEEDGTLNRAKLAAHIFSNESERKKLEKIIHPRIQALFNLKLQEATEENPNLDLIVYEIPLLFESGKERPEFDAVVSVYAKPEIALKRIMDRDGLSEQEGKNRLEAQLSPEKKAKLADFVIDNSSELGDVVSQVKTIYKKLLES